MKTIVVEIKNEKALPLLRKMEKQKLISLENDNSTENKSSNLSSRFAGKLSSETAKKLQKQVAKSRNEWERNF